MDKKLSMIINMHSDISHKTTKYVLPWRLCRTTTKSFFANQIPEDTLCMPKARLIATAADPNNGLKLLFIFISQE